MQASTSVTAVRTSATRRRSVACPGELEGVKVREGSAPRCLARIKLSGGVVKVGGKVKESERKREAPALNTGVERRSSEGE